MRPAAAPAAPAGPHFALAWLRPAETFHHVIISTSTYFRQAEQLMSVCGDVAVTVLLPDAKTCTTPEV
jgi:hypothetical protein